MDDIMSRAGTSQMALFRKVYFWFSLALVITGLTAWVASNNPTIINFLTTSRAAIWILLIVQFGMVWYLSARIMSMSLQSASMLYVLYSFICGITFSFIFLVYAKTTIASAFFITAGMFLVMSIYGFVTKTDLSSIGNILFMGIIGIIIATVVNIFLKSATLNYIISYVGVAIFVALVAYDTQKIKALIGMENNEQTQKLAIIGALSLYLDFLNIFLFILRIFGGGNRN